MVVPFKYKTHLGAHCSTKSREMCKKDMKDSYIWVLIEN